MEIFLCFFIFFLTVWKRHPFCVVAAPAATTELISRTSRVHRTYPSRSRRETRGRELASVIAVLELFWREDRGRAGY